MAGGHSPRGAVAPPRRFGAVARVQIDADFIAMASEERVNIFAMVVVMCDWPSLPC
ncbi:hypothetical protein ACXX9E_29425 [Pseudomonas sp. GNP014]